MKVVIKKSTLSDSLFFFKLRNLYKNRMLFFKSDKISIKDHSQWYSINYKKNMFYTGYVNGKKSGYVRGEFRQDSLLVSVAFLKKFQNKNIATESYRLFEKKN